MIDRYLPRQVRASVTGALLLLAIFPGSACAGMTDTLNKLRAQNCGTRQALRPDHHLDRLAQLVAGGRGLEEAERDAGYHATQVLSLRLSGVSDEGSLAQALGRERCAQLGAPTLRDIGTYRAGTVVWIVLAQPFHVPQARDSRRFAQKVLELTNQARAHPRNCGDTAFPAAPPLRLDPHLFLAAQAHSRDMALNSYMDHKGRDGTTPADRVARTGYPWRLVGENLASGMSSPEEAVKSWLASPHHCANVMGADYREMGLAFGVNMQSPGGVYWTQILAARAADAHR